MGARITTATTLLLGVWVVGCSRQVPLSSERAPSGVPTRDLRMADGADSSGALVSDLEAGRIRAAGDARIAPRLDRPAARTARKVDAVSAAAAVEVAPKLVMTAGAGEVPQTLAAAPLPAPVEQVESVQYNGRAGSQTSDEGGFSAAPISRIPAGPTVIIRGGRGGIDDDCDIHRPMIHRFGGAGGAVHSLAPQFGGYPRGSR